MGYFTLFAMEQTEFVEKIAAKISQLGLAGPAVVLLEAHKPLAFIGSQFLLVAQPTLDLFLPPTYTRNLANLLADPTQLDQLLATLESNISRFSASEEAGS
jgi:hypothetical protein